MLMRELAIHIPQYTPHRIIYVGNTHKLADSGKTAQDNIKHNWNVYLRGEPGTDLTPFIGAVNFHLHPTFNPALVSVHEPPYEVRRVGWGTFVVNICEFIQTILRSRSLRDGSLCSFVFSTTRLKQQPLHSLSSLS